MAGGVTGVDGVAGGGQQRRVATLFAAFCAPRQRSMLLLWRHISGISRQRSMWRRGNISARCISSWRGRQTTRRHHGGRNQASRTVAGSRRRKNGGINARQTQRARGALV
jgi:hypothetical protein